MKHLVLLTILVLPELLFSQDIDSIKKGPLTLWGFGDVYHAYDFNKPEDHNRPWFVYSHNRHNEFALNNGILGVKYSKNKLRSSLALHTGTYVRANYAAEPDILKLIYEANAGFELTKNVWIDAGIFSSHIGCESAISIDNLTLSRSIMADNTPYYETGIKATYNRNDKFTAAVLLLNGWQNIQENNDNKAFGTQIQYRPVKQILLNSSTFIGKERAAYDSISSMRYFHDFYAQIDFNKITVIAAFDMGVQEKRTESGGDIWYNPNLIVRFKPLDKFSIAGRIEYYHDENGVIINTGSPHGFQTFSPSLNIDYWISENMAWRMEGRLFCSRDKVFIKENRIKNNDSFILSSLAIKF